ncbi:hypothetical protein C1I63_02705 [Rathayibacter caricis DSM 15933]|uniref:Uncharacterized protein n=1 Tax=Rathayibacter caricis DSM 15933 TaxID=1328867 RepID=A0A2T4UQQ2_9MICO|nr:hypothetical protein [Rathayibacter caricis]PTL71860.1 hypothetical protein C1I63_02705 [Rathayibacter caricis DSM 15933]
MLVGRGCPVADAGRAAGEGLSRSSAGLDTPLRGYSTSKHSLLMERLRSGSVLLIERLRSGSALLMERLRSGSALLIERLRSGSVLLIE